MNIFSLLQTLGRPVAYGHHSTEQPLPYFRIMGAGQNVFEADNTYYVTRDLTRIEYYFRKKDSTFEAQIEKLLLDNGLLYDKSEDVYVEEQNVFLIYYNV